MLFLLSPNELNACSLKPCILRNRDYWAENEKPKKSKRVTAVSDMDGEIEH